MGASREIDIVLNPTRSWAKYAMHDADLGRGRPVWAGIPPGAAGWPGGVHLLPLMEDETNGGKGSERRGSGVRVFVRLHNDEFESFEKYFFELREIAKLRMD